MLITYHLVPRSRMRGVIPPVPNTSSWRGAQLKHRGNFTFIFISYGPSPGIEPGLPSYKVFITNVLM
jgi:hypothetical protein